METGDRIMAGDAVRVLVVDDQRIIREGITSLLSVSEHIVVVGQAADGREAIAVAEATQPDVVLMDVRMPVLDGIGATREIRRRWPTCQVLVLTTFDDDDYIRDALRAGAIGYLLKDIPAVELAQAVQAAHRRLHLFDGAVAGKLVAALHGDSQGERAGSVAEPLAGGLTAREREVIRLIARGESNREIAETLSISEATVKSHISHILTRLGLRDRTQAALYARDQGWV